MFQPRRPSSSSTTTTTTTTTGSSSTSSLPTIDLTASSQPSQPPTPPSAKRQKTTHSTPSRGFTFPTPTRARGPRQTQIKAFIQTTPTHPPPHGHAGKKGTGSPAVPSAGKGSAGKAGSARGSAKRGNASILSFFKPVASTPTTAKRDRRGDDDDALFIAHGGYGLDVSDPEDAEEDGDVEMWVADRGGDGEEEMVVGRDRDREKEVPVERNLIRELELVEGARVGRIREGDGEGEEEEEMEGEMEEGVGEMEGPEMDAKATTPPKKAPFAGLNLNLGSSMLLGGFSVGKKKDEQGVPGSSPGQAGNDEEMGLGQERTKLQEADSKMGGLSMEDEETNDENLDEPETPVFKIPQKVSKAALPQSTAELLQEDDITSTFTSQPLKMKRSHDSDEVEDFPDEENEEMGFEEQEAMFGFDPAARAIERGFSQVYDDTPPDQVLDEIEFTQDDDPCRKCPICDASLSSLGPAEANSHVNRCLDNETLPPATVLVPSTAPSSTPRPVTKPGEGWFTKPPTARTSNPHAPLNSTPPSSSKQVTAFTKLMSTNAEAQIWAATAKEQAEQYGMRAAERSCPFYKILFNGPITVDAFRYGAVPGCKAYFLSHFHSDHYVGLTSKWDHGPIYCSRVTANLVRTRLHVDPQWVHELPWEEWYVIPDVPGIRVNGLDANHCPGSMMFLFEKSNPGSKKANRILHCGDFRACPEHLKHPLLRPPNRIDTIYLDTTYLNPKYAFPPQSSVVTACGNLCRKLSTTLTTSPNLVTSKTPPRLLILVGTYSIGKERLCVGIAQALQTRIFAPQTKLPTLSSLEDPVLDSLLTHNPAEAQVHMIPLQQLDTPALTEYLSHHQSTFTHIIGFRPSGWNYRPPGSRSKEPRVEDVLWSPHWRSTFKMEDIAPMRGSTERAKVFPVPYSEHSSFRELTMLMCALDIGRVVPTVNVGSEKSRTLMKGWVERWEKQRRKKRFVLEDAEEGGKGLW